MEELTPKLSRRYVVVFSGGSAFSRQSLVMKVPVDFTEVSTRFSELGVFLFAGPLTAFATTILALKS
jgi:hypothetical protein